MAGLSGWDEICTYTKRSRPVIRRWAVDLGFPLVKLGGAVESDTEKIDEWRRRMIDRSGGDSQQGPPPCFEE